MCTSIFSTRCASSPPLTQWVDRLDARRAAQWRAERGVGRWKYEIEADRAAARRYLEDHEARFQEFYRRFFMIDLFRENDARFNLMLTPVEA